MQRLLLSLKSSAHLLLLSSLFVIILQACASKANEKEAPVAAAAAAGIPADGHIVKHSSFSDDLQITGSLVANQEVSIVSELPRKVVQVHVKEGNVVAAGTLLFQLDDADLQAQLERLRQQEKLAALNEARLKDLIEHDAAVQQDYDQAITNLAGTGGRDPPAAGDHRQNSYPRAFQWPYRYHPRLSRCAGICQYRADQHRGRQPY